MEKLTSQIPDKNLTRCHLGKVTQIRRRTGIPLCREEDGTWVNEDAAVLLVEVFDGAGVWVELDGAGYGAGEFLVREGDLGELGVEGACDEGAEEVSVIGAAVPACCCWVFREGGSVVCVGDGEDADVFEGCEELGAVGGDIAEGLVGEEIGHAPRLRLPVALRFDSL